MHIEFLINITGMPLDRSHGDDHVLSDFLIGEPHGKIAKDMYFLRTQQIMYRRS